MFGLRRFEYSVGAAFLPRRSRQEFRSHSYRAPLPTIFLKKNYLIYQLIIFSGRYRPAFGNLVRSLASFPGHVVLLTSRREVVDGVFFRSMLFLTTLQEGISGRQVFCHAPESELHTLVTAGRD